MKSAIKTLDFQGVGIVFSADGWLNATATAQAFGKDRLDNFIASPDFQAYAKIVAESNSLNSSELKRSKRGRYGSGTFLHPELAVVFARWISPAFAYWCDKQVAALIRQAQLAPARNATLRAQRMQKLGASPEAIARRQEGVATRAAFTGALKTHGVNADGYRGCTRAIYQPLFGGGTDKIKEKYGLPENANVRDHMSPVQLLAVGLAEALAAERIEKQNDYGNMACEYTCNVVGKEVAKVITSTRQISA